MENPTRFSAFLDVAKASHRAPVPAVALAALDAGIKCYESTASEAPRTGLTAAPSRQSLAEGRVVWRCGEISISRRMANSATIAM